MDAWKIKKLSPEPEAVLKIKIKHCQNESYIYVTPEDIAAVRSEVLKHLEKEDKPANTNVYVILQNGNVYMVDVPSASFLLHRIYQAAGHDPSSFRVVSVCDFESHLNKQP